MALGDGPGDDLGTYESYRFLLENFLVETFYTRSNRPKSTRQTAEREVR